jgi:cyclopropane-fatty-acyl-phospholipid synthase
MSLFTTDHSKTAYRVDLALYGGAVAGLAVFLLVESPRELGMGLALLAFAGLAGWTLLEYALHRYLLHGVQPFLRWHQEHHDRPQALICTPTILSATLVVTLVLLPSLALGDVWRSGALSLGVLAGYFAYAITHHTTHHWHGGSGWIKERRRWHALHHHRNASGNYGVTTAFWDRAFGSDGESRPAAAKSIVRRDRRKVDFWWT